VNRAVSLVLPLLALGAAGSTYLPRASHVTVVVMENRAYDGIVGNPDAPFVNGVLIPQGALLTRSSAVTHPSQPNYLALFSGSTHGVDGDACPVRFDAPNVASLLAAAGRSFVGLAESMPYDGFTGCTSDDVYGRKHDPWVDFSNVPPSANRVYRRFPPADAPALMWITPNMCHDMHDCSTRTGDAWLAKNLPPILAWDRSHDGLLIVTWDEAEPDAGGNRIPTILAGPMVRAGSRTDRPVDHYGVLRTIETIFGLSCIDRECRAKPIEGIWK